MQTTLMKPLVTVGIAVLAWGGHRLLPSAREIPAASVADMVGGVCCHFDCKWSVVWGWDNGGWKYQKFTTSHAKLASPDNLQGSTTGYTGISMTNGTRAYADIGGNGTPSCIDWALRWTVSSSQYSPASYPLSETEYLCNAVSDPCDTSG